MNVSNSFCATGVVNLDSGVGVYAPDADSYTLFKPLFDPIIEEYHNGFGPNQKQPETDLGEGRFSPASNLKMYVYTIVSNNALRCKRD